MLYYVMLYYYYAVTSRGKYDLLIIKYITQQHNISNMLLGYLNCNSTPQISKKKLKKKLITRHQLPENYVPRFPFICHSYNNNNESSGITIYNFSLNHPLTHC